MYFNSSIYDYKLSQCCVVKDIVHPQSLNATESCDQAKATEQRFPHFEMCGVHFLSPETFSHVENTSAVQETCQ